VSQQAPTSTLLGLGIVILSLLAGYYMGKNKRSLRADDDSYEKQGQENHA
tara:strand:- start:97 stop:246 length:150 start_codon:yes stop_codon:yes gene_type:complete